MGKIMTFKETAKCPICGLLLEKQEKVIHLGIPAIKAECPDCGYVSYFFDKKAQKQLDHAMELKDQNEKKADYTGDNSKNYSELSPSDVISHRGLDRKVNPFLSLLSRLTHRFLPQRIRDQIKLPSRSDRNGGC